MESCLLRKAVGEDELHELDFHRDSSLFDERRKLAFTFATVALETFYALVNRTPGLKPQGFRESAVPEPEAPGE